MSASASTIFVAPSSQTVWQRKTSCSPSPSDRIPTLPASRSAAARVSGGSALTTLLRSRPSASKSVCTRPSLSSIPQCGSIRNRRMPSSSCCGDVVALVGDEPAGIVRGRERVVGAGEDDLVEAVVAELRRAVAALGEAGHGAVARARAGGDTTTATTTAAIAPAATSQRAPSERLRAVLRSAAPAGGCSSSQQLPGAEVDEPGAEQQADDASANCPVEREDEPGDDRQPRPRAVRPERCSLGRSAMPADGAGPPGRRRAPGRGAAAAPAITTPEQPPAPAPRRRGRRGTHRGSRPLLRGGPRR